MPIDLSEYKLFQSQTIKTFVPLENQGFCNINHVVKTCSNSYLIREFKHTLVDRAFEFKVQKKAHTKSLAPNPLLLDIEKSIMITEFTHGEHKFTLKRKELRKLALALRKLHKIKVRKKPHSHKKDFKPKHKKANLTLLKLKKYKKDLVLCHHDLNPKNIFFSNKIVLIDWEFAGVNDRYFDLATVCVEFKLNWKMEKYFLQHYAHAHSQKKLELYKILYKELYRVWMGENTTPI
ncbi:phosphotransferase [bacterium]|nr:phosphotransferase [bacterium]MBU1959208.1 phosphotransferase [bacterium]